MRLAIAVALSLTLIVADSRYRHLEFLRSTLSVALYPVHYLAALPSRLSRAVDAQLATEAQLREQNRLLARENLELKGRMQTFEALYAENRRLSDLLGSSIKLRDRVMVASLLEVDLDPYRQQVLVDKGSSSGIFVGQPVLDADAVMGQVVRTSPLTATVLLITDAAHSLPVQINRNGLRSVATGSGLINRLNLLHLPKNADVRPGDLLVTSGLGGVFPPGYPVARIIKVGDDPGSHFATVVAEPTARLDRSHEVLLVWSLDAPPVSAGDEAGTSVGIGAGKGTELGSGMGSGLGSGMGSGLGSGMESGIASGMGSGIGHGIATGTGSGVETGAERRVAKTPKILP